MLLGLFALITLSFWGFSALVSVALINLVLFFCPGTDLWLLDHPVEHEVVVVAHAIEEVFEKFAEVGDVGLLLEFHLSAVVEIDVELIRHALGQGLDRGRELLVSDLLVLLFLGTGWQALPWELTFVEVDQQLT